MVVPRLKLFSKNLSKIVLGITWMIFACSYVCLLQVFDTESLTQGLGLLGISLGASQMWLHVFMVWS